MCVLVWVRVFREDAKAPGKMEYQVERADAWEEVERADAWEDEVKGADSWEVERADAWEDEVEGADSWEEEAPHNRAHNRGV